MRKILVIADDLSGAADCTGAFAKVAMDTVVVFDDGAAPTASASVIAVDADSRSLPASQAARRHQALHARYYRDGMLFYKKIDSTLRGNFAEELAAIAARSGLAIVAPAFPEAGRTTRNGCKYLHGAPLELSEVWRAGNLAGTADVTGMIVRHGLRAVTADLSMLRKGPDELATLLASLAGARIQAVVCDAETNDDLRLIAQASLQLPIACFWVGSAGLAAQLAMATSLPLPAIPPGPVRVENSGSWISLPTLLFPSGHLICEL